MITGRENWQKMNKLSINESEPSIDPSQIIQQHDTCGEAGDKKYKPCNTKTGGVTALSWQPAQWVERYESTSNLIVMT